MQETKMIKQFKELTRQGNYPPVKVIEHIKEGFTVIAEEEI